MNVVTDMLTTSCGSRTLYPKCRGVTRIVNLMITLKKASGTVIPLPCSPWLLERAGLGCQLDLINQLFIPGGNISNPCSKQSMEMREIYSLRRRFYQLSVYLSCRNKMKERTSLHFIASGLVHKTSHIEQNII